MCKVASMCVCIPGIYVSVCACVYVSVCMCMCVSVYVSVSLCVCLTFLWCFRLKAFAGGPVWLDVSVLMNGSVCGSEITVCPGSSCLSPVSPRCHCLSVINVELIRSH